MSLKEMLEKKRKKLNPTRTKVTTADGRIYMEENGAIEEVDEKTAGFVVDLKPDLSVGVVRPWLYLAGQDVAADLDILRRCEIKRILNVGSGIQNWFPQQFQYSNLEILDIPEHDITTDLINCAEIIEQSGEKKENILVHCNAGVSRAPTVVIGYLIIKENLDFVTAFDVVKSVRNCVNPNQGFISQLKELKRKR